MKFIILTTVLAVAAATDCSTLKGAGEKTCNADAGCTWCKSGAVPPSCYALADAKKLPAGVFICDTKPKKRRSEILSREATEALGVVWRGNSSKTDSHALLSAPASYPDSFSWCNKDGKSYCTMSRNQHIPQYCGSCWAHGTISALGDRVKIARNAEGIDVNLAVQHVLACGGVGSCYGGSVDGAYQWIKKISDETGTGVAYETSNPYIACSSDSKEGFCGHVDTTCTPLNVARTCGSFDKEGGDCTGLSNYPNVTIKEYGSISGKDAMMKEIFARGPIACGIDASPLLNFETGIATEAGDSVDHVISVVGWGMDEAKKQQYWIVRNSWGEYWGDMGYVNVAFGALHIEDQCTWAVPGGYTAAELNNQVHCHEGGDNCKSKAPASQVVV
jgi:cathepsin X